MSSKAVAWLERDYDAWDADEFGWDISGRGKQLYGGGTNFASIKIDMLITCWLPGYAEDTRCQHDGHVGVPVYTHAPQEAAYGDEWWKDGDGYEWPPYNIPLIEGHWKRPCP